MPFTTIEVHEGITTPESRSAISDAIHAAMIEVLGIPEDDRFHAFHILPEGTMFHEATAFGRPRSDRYMFVTLSFNQRSAEVKNALFDSLVLHLTRDAGISEDDVAFRIIETASENWWASGRVVDPTTGYDERMQVTP